MTGINNIQYLFQVTDGLTNRAFNIVTPTSVEAHYHTDGIFGRHSLSSHEGNSQALSCRGVGACHRLPFHGASPATLSQHELFHRQLALDDFDPQGVRFKRDGSEAASAGEESLERPLLQLRPEPKRL